MKGRKFILEIIDEALEAKARLKKVCEIIELSARTVQRWRKNLCDDKRKHNTFKTSNALTARERQNVLDTVCSSEFRNLPPGQIVPKLADSGTYIASESTIYRILKAFGLSRPRTDTKAPKREKPRELVATGSNQVWSWDISYLLCTKKHVYFYLYFVIDIWDRSIVSWAVHESESGENASALIHEACISHNVNCGSLYLHSDNGAPMVSLEYLSATSLLGVECSYSRPGMSDDNPYSESLFRTTKYRPGYPERFESIEDARNWILKFVAWYNNEHLHSGIKFVTPAQRRSGEDEQLLKARKETYEAAKKANPDRWSGNTRNWDKPECVTLNPKGGRKKELLKCA